MFHVPALPCDCPALLLGKLLAGVDGGARLTFAVFAIWVGVASGSALSAARARSRASWRAYLRFRRKALRGFDRAALRGRPRGRSRSSELAVRARSSGAAGGSGSALRS